VLGFTPTLGQSRVATLWDSKVVGVPILGISRLPLGSLETK